MNTLRLLVVLTVMAFSLGGCTHHGPKLGAGLSPGVIVTNPALQPPGAGNGFLTVVWTSSQSGLNGQANWWINPASPRPIPTTTFVMLAGNATVTFGPLAGYTPPPPKPIHVWKGQTTILTVTYGQP
jgi:hypothetical protein